MKSMHKIVFKFRKTGVKYVQNAVHSYLQEVEIDKQHDSQLIAVSSGVTFRMCCTMHTSILLSVQSEYGTKHLSHTLAARSHTN